MSAPSDGNKHISLSLSHIELLCPVAKALSSPMRVRMLALLGVRSMNVNELAEALSLPVSTAALNVRQLEDAGLIATAIQPGIRGAMKLCSRRIDSVSMRLTPDLQDAADAITIQLPIGSYSCAEAITAPCGMVSDHGWIGESDAARTFYHPDRLSAQLIWLRSGALEYRLSLGEIDPAQVAFLEFSMELCSNAPMYREDYKSDINVCVNGVNLGVFTCPGDFGGRRGRLNPSWWSDTSSQYGLLKTWRVGREGTTLDGEPLSAVCLRDLHLASGDYVSLRIGVDAGAENVGGLNLFGDRFGDYAQGIVMRVGYDK
ncbi:MAG: ArsR/SmtB family transcription factor [Candidatus Ventricola sp.]